MCKLEGGIPASLSATVFNLPTNKVWIWTVTIVAICFLCIPTFISKTSDNTRFLAFLSIAGLLFVGGAPLCRMKDYSLQYNVHCYSAVLCAVCSQLVLAFNCPWLLLLWIPIIGVTFKIGLDNFKTKVFWGEMTCFASTFIYCLI